MNNHNQQNNSISQEDYSKAMNLIGQNLLQTLMQSVQSLEPSLRKKDLVMQGVAAFLANVVYQQANQDADRHNMLQGFVKLVQTHLGDIPEQVI